MHGCVNNEITHPLTCHASFTAADSWYYSRHIWNIQRPSLWKLTVKSIRFTLKLTCVRYKGFATPWGSSTWHYNTFWALTMRAEALKSCTKHSMNSRKTEPFFPLWLVLFCWKKATPLIGRLLKNVPDRSSFKTAADRRLQKASVSRKVFLNYYSEHTVYIRNTYATHKEEQFPAVRLPGWRIAWLGRELGRREGARELEKSNNN